MKTIIMAGGRGTRLASCSQQKGRILPKPLVSVAGIPILERELAVLQKQGFTDILLTVSYLGYAIQEYFGDGSGVSPVTGDPFGVHIEYFIESEPLGNAGALLKIRDSLTEDFLLLNADILFDVDLHRLVDFHYKCGGLATLMTHANDHPFDSGLIICEEDGQVKNWLAKEDDRPHYYSNRVNAGLHVLSPRALDRLSVDSVEIVRSDCQTKPVRVDLDRQILKPLAGTGLLYCYNSPEYVRDMGTPERLAQAEHDIENGLVMKKSLRHKQKAFFLDRDGTINRAAEYLTELDEFELLPGVAEAIRYINMSGFLCLVVTNQPAVARGELTLNRLREIHDKMETLLGNYGAYIDGIYYCPHHPDKGFKGEVSALKIDCECRKPKPGMIFRAAEEFNIDLGASWMIGDSWRDMECGRVAGTHTCMLADSESDNEVPRDLTCFTLLEAVKKILFNEKFFSPHLRWGRM